MRKIMCFLLDHKISSNYTDSGYPICKRCNSHSYYDCFIEPTIWSRGGILKLPFRWIKSFCIKNWVRLNHKRHDSKLPF